MKRINEAYSVLKDETSRKAYDAILLRYAKATLPQDAAATGNGQGDAHPRPTCYPGGWHPAQWPPPPAYPAGFGEFAVPGTGPYAHPFAPGTPPPYPPPGYVPQPPGGHYAPPRAGYHYQAPYPPPPWMYPAAGCPPPGAPPYPYPAPSAGYSGYWKWHPGVGGPPG